MRQLCRLDSHCISRFTADRNSGTDDVTPIVVMQRTSCCWPTNGLRYVLAELGSVPSVPEFVPNLSQAIVSLNKKWFDTRRKPEVVPPPNDTSPLANVSYYKPGTPMTDNTYFYVRPSKEAGGFFTIEDNIKIVLAWGRTIEEIAVKWHQLDDQKIIVERFVRQGSGSSHRLLNLI